MSRSPPASESLTSDRRGLGFTPGLRLSGFLTRRRCLISESSMTIQRSQNPPTPVVIFRPERKADPHTRSQYLLLGREGHPSDHGQVLAHARLHRAAPAQGEATHTVHAEHRQPRDPRWNPPGQAHPMPWVIRHGLLCQVQTQGPGRNHIPRPASGQGCQV